MPGLDDADLAELMRAQLLQLLLDGDEEALRRFAREAVEQLGRGHALAVGAVVLQLPGAAGALAGHPGLPAAGGAARARGTAAGWPSRWPGRRSASGWPRSGRRSRRRCAGGRRRRRAGTRSRRTPSARWPTRSTSCGRSPATWPSCAGPWRRWPGGWRSGCPRGAGSGREGRLDFRKTVRASLGTGGVPVVTHHRPRKVHKPELVVLCDVSGSVAGFSHFTLMLTQALREHFTGVRAFAFVDTTDEVTRFFRPGADVVDAVARIGREADVVGFDGHSDYGTAFEVFADRWPSAVGPKTSLLVLGDGRTNYRPAGAAGARRPGPPLALGALAQPRAAPAVGERRLGRATGTARSSTWSSAATPPSWRSSSPPSDARRDLGPGVVDELSTEPLVDRRQSTGPERTSCRTCHLRRSAPAVTEPSVGAVGQRGAGATDRAAPRRATDARRGLRPAARGSRSRRSAQPCPRAGRPESPAGAGPHGAGSGGPG